MKYRNIFGAIAIVMLTMTTPSTLLAQSWWEGFADAVQSNAFWDYLQQYPQIAELLQQNPYQIYNPDWRAQYPQLQQYINNNPGWWNSVRSNGSQHYDTAFTQFLNNHPKVARDLSQNPELIYKPSYLAKHPQLKAFLASHKKTWQTAKNKKYMYSPRGGWGAYNNNGEYRDETWWKTNGDWDQQNKWHDRAWWLQKMPARVQQYHPDWLSK